MTVTRLSIFILGLSTAIVPARASLSFYCGSGCASASSQFTTDSTTAGLSITSVASFSTTNLGGTPINTEYLDPSLVDFFSYTASGSNVGALTAFRDPTASNTTLAPKTFLEITLPANVFSFALNITQILNSTPLVFCLEDESPFSSSDCNALSAQDQQVTVTSNTDTEFIGVISTTALTTLWIGGLNGGNVDVQNFEFGTQSGSQGGGGGDAPDVGTMLTLGSGLVLLAALHRRRTRAPLVDARGSETEPRRL